MSFLSQDLKQRCTSVSFLFLLLMGRVDKGTSQEKGDMTQVQNVPQRLMCLDTWSPSSWAFRHGLDGGREFHSGAGLQVS